MRQLKVLLQLLVWRSRPTRPIAEGPRLLAALDALYGKFLLSPACERDLAATAFANCSNALEKYTLLLIGALGFLFSLFESFLLFY
jgi:hypothetical protein